MARTLGLPSKLHDVAGFATAQSLVWPLLCQQIETTRQHCAAWPQCEQPIRKLCTVCTAQLHTALSSLCVLCGEGPLTFYRCPARMVAKVGDYAVFHNAPSGTHPSRPGEQRLEELEARGALVAGVEAVGVAVQCNAAAAMLEQAQHARCMRLLRARVPCDAWQQR